MNYTIDASVFVSAIRAQEEFFLPSRELVRQFENSAIEKYCPALVLPECAAAIARASNDPQSAAELVTLLKYGGLASRAF